MGIYHLNGMLSCVDFMDVIMGIYHLNGMLSCVDFMDVIIGDIYRLNGILPCVDFMAVIMGDIPMKISFRDICVFPMLCCLWKMHSIFHSAPSY